MHLEVAETPALEQCSSQGDLVRYLGRLARNGQDLRRFGTFSPSIYDTAWLSMVHRKHEDGTLLWIFPECFDFVIAHQLEDGSWPAYASTLDGIINTLAALLALLTRRSKLSEQEPLNGEDGSYHDLSLRIENAKSALRSLLWKWSVDETDRVGFEILIPSLLSQISLFDVDFQFPGQERLMELNAHKLAKFRPEITYSKLQTTLLHSLEALIGKVDFDKVQHHCYEETGMLGSPASTAAYLMNCSSWDDRAETYLKHAVEAFRYLGGVPSAYPTYMFEISWALSTLFTNGISPTATEIEQLRPIMTFFREILAQQNGITGFAPGILADADDTARVLLMLQHLGDEVSFSPLITKFRSESHFRTYEFEQNPSFSANCNVLLGLVHSRSIDDFITTEIERTTRFLLLLWNSGNVSDKWNISSHYSLMLLSSAFVKLLQRYDNSDIVGLPDALILREIPICLCQILTRILSSQNENGSWDNTSEVTAYSILAISQMLCLPFGLGLRLKLVSSVSQGRDYIVNHQYQSIQSHTDTDYLWIEKVIYGSALLRKTYTIAAIHAHCEELRWTRKNLISCFQVPVAAARRVNLLFNEVPLFKTSPLISMDLALLEAIHWSKSLYEHKYAVFPKEGMQAGKDKYLEFIPIIWTSCNQLAGNDALPSDTMWAMILLSLLIYQLDEFMESIVIHMSEHAMQILETRIRRECTLEDDRCPQIPENTGSHMEADNQQGESAALTNGDHASFNSVIGTLHQFIQHILQHPSVVKSVPTLQKEISDELYNFLVAHLTHIRDNRILRAEWSQQSNLPTANQHTSTWRNYYKWVNSVGGDDTSCPVSYWFFISLISNPGQYCFDNPRSRYLSQSLMRHLTTMCRQYNDYGSAVRDRDEGNLNSLDFVDFHEKRLLLPNPGAHEGSNGNKDKEIPTQDVKDQLMEIAEFERSCLQLTLGHLAKATTSRAIMKRLGVFVDVTDLFGQLYIQKDLTNRVATNGATNGVTH